MSHRRESIGEMLFDSYETAAASHVRRDILQHIANLELGEIFVAEEGTTCYDSSESEVDASDMSPPGSFASAKARKRAAAAPSPGPAGTRVWVVGAAGTRRQAVVVGVDSETQQVCLRIGMEAVVRPLSSVEPLQRVRVTGWGAAGCPVYSDCVSAATADPTKVTRRIAESASAPVDVEISRESEGCFQLADGTGWVPAGPGCQLYLPAHRGGSGYFGKRGTRRPSYRRASVVKPFRSLPDLPPPTATKNKQPPLEIYYALEKEEAARVELMEHPASLRSRARDAVGKDRWAELFWQARLAAVTELVATGVVTGKSVDDANAAVGNPSPVKIVVDPPATSPASPAPKRKVAKRSVTATHKPPAKSGGRSSVSTTQKPPRPTHRASCPVPGRLQSASASAPRAFTRSQTTGHPPPRAVVELATKPRPGQASPRRTVRRPTPSSASPPMLSSPKSSRPARQRPTKAQVAAAGPKRAGGRQHHPAAPTTPPLDPPVRDWLLQHGFVAYLDRFAKYKVCRTRLPHITRDDLIYMGFPKSVHITMLSLLPPVPVQ